MIKDRGIRTLVPGVVTTEEEKEIKDARKYIRKKLGISNKLQAAPTRLVSDYLPSMITPKLPAEKKDEFGYTPSQNKEIEKVITRPSPPPGLWKNFVKASEKTDNKEEALAQALIESNKLAEKESPKQTWNRLDSNEKKRQQVVKNELAEKAAEKKHLK